jgi:hypothetical protein
MDSDSNSRVGEFFYGKNCRKKSLNMLLGSKNSHQASAAAEESHFDISRQISRSGRGGK